MEGCENKAHEDLHMCLQCYAKMMAEEEADG
jgi:hypothetical protein